MVFINGLFSKNANGIYQNKYGWWKDTNGIVNFKENGVFQNSFGWWRVKDSKVDFNAQGIYQNNFGWWKTTNGKVTFKENGVFQNEFGWWKVKDSKVDFSFTGIASNKYGSWYIKNGKVDFNKKGKVKYNNKNYTLGKGFNINEITLDKAIELLGQNSNKNVIATFAEDENIKVMNGHYGAYLTNGSNNFKIPKDKNPETLTYADCLQIMSTIAPSAKKRGKKKKK